LGGAVSLLASIGAGGVFGTVAGFVVKFPLGLRLALAVSVFLLVAAAVFAMFGWVKTRPPAVEATGTTGVVGGDLTAGGDVSIAGVNVAGGDLTIHQRPGEVEQLRAVWAEVKHVQDRLRQIARRAEARQGWVRPPRSEHYERVPSQTWNLHSDACGLPAADRVAIQDAYDRASIFDDEMLRRDDVGFGEPEPDLAGVADAFADAAARIDAALRART
jgi:uncharacterized membrane protein